ncbi:MAG: ArsR/SmtB family transcription factor [Dehalococcoidales bacterium]
MEIDKQKLLYSILDETRIKIITILNKNPQNISELDKMMGINRSKICYHLNILEESGILKFEYNILKETHSKGRAIKTYSINTNKLGLALKAVDELRNTIKID